MLQVAVASASQVRRGLQRGNGLLNDASIYATKYGTYENLMGVNLPVNAWKQVGPALVQDCARL